MHSKKLADFLKLHTEPQVNVEIQFKNNSIKNEKYMELNKKRTKCAL